MRGTWVDRRGLLTGAAAVAAMASLGARAEVITGTPGLQTRDIRLKQLTPLMAVNSQCPLADGTQTDTTNNTLNTRRLLVAPTACDLVDIVIAVPGYFYNPAETDMPTAFTVTAAVEYPIGTLNPVYTNGSRTLAITPGRTMPRFDPWPGYVPAGAAYAIKLFVSWTPGSMPLQYREGGEITGCWTARGTGLTDQTLTATVFSSTNNQTIFGNVQVFARYSNPQVCIGILGDSINHGLLDRADPVTGAVALEKMFRNVVPVINTSRDSDAMSAYLARREGRDAYFRDPITGSVTITDLIMGMGRNEISGASVAAMRAKFLSTITPWLDRGVRVHALTLLPKSASSDSWVTLANQTVDAASDTYRTAWNNDLRANAISTYGCTRVIDWSLVVDPTDSGKWSVDGVAGNGALLVPTMTGRAISSVARAFYTGGDSAYGGTTYPASTSPVCTVRPYPGDVGTFGGGVTGSVNNIGQYLTASVTAGGDYGIPPMIVTPGQWTGDGLHPNVRAYQEIIYRLGLGPSSFVL